MSLQIGDNVRLIDEPGQGKVTAVEGDTVTVEMDGMDFSYASNELVKVEHDNLIDHRHDDVEISSKDRNLRQHGRDILDGLDDQDQATYELDLHIHELLDHYSNMSNGEILQYQMGRCRAFVREAIDKRFPKVVLIHGVGEGVLKHEIHKYLDQLDRVEYHDAPYRIYGYGATEVIIR